MWIVEGLVAGLIAGIFMGVITEIGYILGLFRANLLIVDGSFALHLMKRSSSNIAVYLMGTLIHLVTSMIFGIAYVVVAMLFNFNERLIIAIAIYVLVLWIAMLLVALPIAGQGILGKKISRVVWAEQLVLHIIFGLGFWWALGLI